MLIKQSRHGIQRWHGAHGAASATPWHLAINLKSALKWASDETELGISMCTTNLISKVRSRSCARPLCQQSSCPPTVMRRTCCMVLPLGLHWRRWELASFQWKYGTCNCGRSWNEIDRLMNADQQRQTKRVRISWVFAQLFTWQLIMIKGPFEISSGWRAT